MSLLIWNVRGFNKEGRLQDVKDHLQIISPVFVALVETKVKHKNVRKLSGCVPQGWLLVITSTYLTKAGSGLHGILTSRAAQCSFAPLNKLLYSLRILEDFQAFSLLSMASIHLVRCKYFGLS